MNFTKLFFAISSFCVCLAVAEAQVTIQLHSDKVENRISDKVYGFLLEHLYHSVSNGLWGENVWNRSFEELLAYGDWTVDSRGEIILNAIDKQMADFRICRGKNYEITLEVKRLRGDGAVLVGVRDQNRDRMLTNRIYFYLGAERNSIHKLEASTGWVWHTPLVHTEVTNQCAGTLPVNEWVKVRVRCEGNKLSGWVGDSQIFSRTIDKCPLDGAVTLGGEQCEVAFRNIEVIPLNDEKITVNLNPIRHWNLIGEGSEKAIFADVLNHNTALCIQSSGKMAGIEQTSNYSVRRNDALKGSIYLRGNVSKAKVQLLDENKVISEQVIDGITSEWKEYPLTLVSKKNVPLASLRIITNETGCLYVDQVSLMHQSSIDNQGFRVELTNAVADIKPTILRWPGGSFSEQYHFEDGLGKQLERKGILRWDDFDPLSFGTDEFIAFCKKVGAEPQIVVPIGYHNYAGYSPDLSGKHDWLQRALDWMDYCNGDSTTEWGRKRIENGHPEPYDVKYWEIDNEVWKMEPRLYAQLTRIFSIEMKKRYPEVKIIGCGCGRLGREGVGLDSIMITDVAEYIDYISPHYYQTLNRYGNDGVEEYGKYLDKLAYWISNSKNPDMKIYLSEWNLDGIDMRTGLFAGGFLNRLERTPQLEMAAPALFLRHTSASGWNNAFINFDQNGWFPAPNYVVFKLWREHFQPNRISLSGDTKCLNVVATASDDKKEVCVKIVNPTEIPIDMVIENVYDLGTPVWQVVNAASLNDVNTMEQPDRIKAVERKTTTKGNDIVLSVPALSASVLTFCK